MSGRLGLLAPAFIPTSMPESAYTGWTGLWAVWSRWRCPCPWQGDRPDSLKVLSQPTPFYGSSVFHSNQGKTIKSACSKTITVLFPEKNCNPDSTFGFSFKQLRSLHFHLYPVCEMSTSCNPRCFAEVDCVFLFSLGLVFLFALLAAREEHNDGQWPDSLWSCKK